MQHARFVSGLGFHRLKPVSRLGHSGILSNKLVALGVRIRSAQHVERDVEGLMSVGQSVSGENR